MRIILTLTLILAASPLAAWDRYETAMYLTAAVDFTSTEIALANGFHEANPRQQRRLTRIGTVAAQVALTQLLYRRLRRDGHDGWARAIILIPTISHGAAAGWNVGVMVRW